MILEIYCDYCKWNLTETDKIVECACCDQKFHDDCKDKHLLEMKKKQENTDAL